MCLSSTCNCRNSYRVYCIAAACPITGSVTLRSIYVGSRGDCRHYRQADDEYGAAEGIAGTIARPMMNMGCIVTPCAVALLSHLLHVYTHDKSSISPDIHQDFGTDIDTNKQKKERKNKGEKAKLRTEVWREILRLLTAVLTPLPDSSLGRLVIMALEALWLRERVPAPA